jgi:hypothetical protein
VPLAIPLAAGSFPSASSGFAPAALRGARPIRGRAFGRIEDTLSVLDKGTALTLTR